MGKGLKLAKWHRLSIKKKFILFSNEKSSLIQVPNSNYRFWYPNKIIKEKDNGSEIAILYTKDMKFRIFKSKKVGDKWIQYDDKTVNIVELKEIIDNDDLLKLFCDKKSIIYQNKTSYLIGYINSDYNYTKFWISKKCCSGINILTVLLCEDEYQIEVDEDSGLIKKNITAKELKDEFRKSYTHIEWERLKAPKRLEIPKNITIDDELKDDSSYNETGVLQTKTTLFTHQQKAVAKVLPSKYNALFMDMGTGKTRTTIELLKIREGKYDKVFWITPVTLKYNVYLEFLKHTNLSKDDIYVFDDKTTNQLAIKQKYIIVGIESISSSDRVFLALKSIISEDSFIIVDESSFIRKNSKRTKRIIGLTRHTKYRTILTGTPISKGIVDLYYQISFLSPKILGYRNFYQFEKNHLQYHKKIPGMIINEFNEDYIAAKINPYVYQVTKDECLDLKEKRYIDKYFIMSDKQYYLYELIKEDFFQKFESYETDSIFQLFNDLQQVISGFQYTKDKETKIVDTSRVDFLQEIINEIDKQHKIIIWVKYKADIELIEPMIKKEFKDSGYVIFDGSKSESEKANALNDFKYNTNTRFFIATQSTGAFGLNLTEATYTIFYNNSFKYSERMQAEDRNYRIGQNESVTYIDVICSHSIDVKIHNTLILKEDIATSFRKDLDKIKDKKLKKSLLNAILEGDVEKANEIIAKAEAAQNNTAAKRMEKMRRKRGVIPREEYIKNSLTYKAPWKELGISRATWYRKKGK